MRKLKAIMSSPDKGSTNPGLGILARLYRRLLVKTNVTLTSLDAMVNRWLDDPANEIPKDSKTRSFVRGNLMKALSEDDMTFKTFIKGTMVLNPDEVEIIVRYKYPTRTIEEMVSFSLNDVDVASLDYPDPDDNDN
jgi:hypothetical protein